MIEKSIENAGIKNGENAYVEICGDGEVIERPILVDCLRTKVILRNLLSNALKHSSRSKAHIKVSVCGRQIEDSPEREERNDEDVSGQNGRSSYIEMSVSDNGGGIDERSDSTRGWGMCLKIVRSIVSDLRGKIRATSRQGEGATFFITLPEDGASLTAEAAA